MLDKDEIITQLTRERDDARMAVKMHLRTVEVQQACLHPSTQPEQAKPTDLQALIRELEGVIADCKAGCSIIQQAATPARVFITLNHTQIKELLDATDGDDDLGPTEITLIKHAEPFKSTDGEDMPAGVYFYWTEYPEEGIVHLTAPHDESDNTVRA